MAKNKDLEELVTLELTNLERLKKELNQLLLTKKDEKSSYEVRAAGSILHDFYCGVEKIFERTAVIMDKNLPDGSNWHTNLLLQMGKPIDSVRDKLISEELIERLKEFLRFRHLFRHLYGFELKWERIKPLCDDLEKVLADLKKEIEVFFERDIAVDKE